MTEEKTPVRVRVMEAIRKGDVHMRPRWHFILLSVLIIVGALILFLTALYLSSLALFFLQDSGAWFAPSFGPRGWWDLLATIPWLLVLLAALFIVVLELLVRRYKVVYQKPLLTSVLLILLVVTLGGFVIARTPFHRQLMVGARHGQLPPPLVFFYGDMLRKRPPDEMYRGLIAEIHSGGIVVIDPNHPGTTTVYFTPHTRLPYGADFSIGEMVLVVGDKVGTDTLEAYGVRDIDY